MDGSLGNEGAEAMNYRTIADLNRALVCNLHRVPRDVDVIVGIPRSGLLAANLLALHLNLPLTDVEGFGAQRLLSGGRRTEMAARRFEFETARKALVIDDSVCSGFEMRRTRLRLSQGAGDCELIYAAVYATKHARKYVDLYFELCATPRVFEWNIMHHWELRRACVDIDGVLCRDPTNEENDDGPKYEEFLLSAEPLIIPTLPIGTLVTCRLEKYRKLTEEWLHRHGVVYDELIMMQYATKAERILAGSHGRFKGEVFRSLPAVLFIESSPQQASEIARISGKPTLCFESREMIQPPFMKAAPRKLRRMKWRVEKRLKRTLGAVAHTLGLS